MRLITVLSASSILCCSIHAQNTYDASFLEYTGLRYICDQGLTPVVKIQNVGSSTMNTCVVETWKGGIMVNSFNWELAVPAAPNEVRQPVLPSIPDAEANEIYEFRIISVNEQPDEGANGNVLTVELNDEPAVAQTDEVTVAVMPGMSPGIYTWTIKNELGQSVGSAGPFDNSFPLYETVVQLSPFSCYEFTVSGDNDPTDLAAGIWVFSAGEPIIGLTSMEYDGFAKGLTTDGNIGVTEWSEAVVQVSYDAASGSYLVRSNEPITSIQMNDMSGRLVKQINGGMNEIRLIQGSVPAGVYGLFITFSRGGSRMCKVIMP